MAVAVVAAAFAFRALVRGPSFDRGDALVLALFAVVLAVTAFVRRWVAAADERERTDSGIDDARGADESAADERERGDKS